MKSTKCKLSNEEIKVLEHLAHVSKMDCWFCINEKGKIIDLEDESRVLNTRCAIQNLIDGFTEDDMHYLNEKEVYIFTMLLGRLLY